MGGVEKMGIKLSQPQLELKLSSVELRLSLAKNLASVISSVQGGWTAGSRWK